MVDQPIAVDRSPSTIVREARGCRSTAEIGCLRNGTSRYACAALERRCRRRRCADGLNHRVIPSVAVTAVLGGRNISKLLVLTASPSLVSARTRSGQPCSVEQSSAHVGDAVRSA